MTRAEMEVKVQAAILASALLNSQIKNARVAISKVALDALLPTEVAGYQANAPVGAPAAGDCIHPTEIQAICQPVALRRKPVYQMLVE